jgi:hypothetical protein
MHEFIVFLHKLTSCGLKSIAGQVHCCIYCFDSFSKFSQNTHCDIIPQKIFKLIYNWCFYGRRQGMTGKKTVLLLSIRTPRRSNGTPTIAQLLVGLLTLKLWNCVVVLPRRKTFISKAAVFWFVATCWLVWVYQRFKRSIITRTTKAVQTSETLVNSNESTRSYNPEDSHRHLCTRRRENLKYY